MSEPPEPRMCASCCARHGEHEPWCPRLPEPRKTRAPSPQNTLAPCPIKDEGEETAKLGKQEATTEPVKASPQMEALRQAYRALDAIERIVGDDWCSDLEMRTLNENLTGDAKIMEEKISQIYRIAHSESPNHSCHHVHTEWRKTKDLILEGETPCLN